MKGIPERLIDLVGTAETPLDLETLERLELLKIAETLKNEKKEEDE